MADDKSAADGRDAAPDDARHTGNQPSSSERPNLARASTDRRRAAWIATALTIPLVVILALIFTVGRAPDKSRSAATGPVTVDAPTATVAQVAKCQKVIEQLPVTLQGRKPRNVRPAQRDGDITYVVAWGDPAIVLACGVPRPKSLSPGSADLVIDGGKGDKTAQFLVSHAGEDNIFTAIDRAVYIEIRIPRTYHSEPLPTLAAAIATGLPAVCQAVPQPLPSNYDPSNAKLCVNRHD